MQLTIGLIVGLVLFIPILYGVIYVLIIACGVYNIICEGFGDKFKNESIKCDEPNEKLIEKIYYYPFKVRIIITKDRRLFLCEKDYCEEWL